MADIKDVINTLDEAIDGFEKVVGASQMEMYKELLELMKDLETINGHVKQTIHNLKLLTAIKAKLGKIANNDKYISGVEKLIGYFDKLQGQQNDYFSRNFAEQTLGMEAKKKHDLMKQIAVQNTINALTDDGLKAGVTDKINDILLRAVTTGAKFGDLQEELRAHMLGKDGGQGALARYATTYATTSISQFTGQNNKLLTQDLGMQWFMYVGSNIETTREFCQHLTRKRYIHITEIPTILAGKIDDHQCAIYAKTGLPYGLIEGTNEENFQVNCGGWNCRHQLVPVHELAVPADIRAKFANAKEAGSIVYNQDVKTAIPDFQEKEYREPVVYAQKEAERRESVIRKAITKDEISSFADQIVDYYKNCVELEQQSLKQKGEPMKFDDADGGHVNPNYVDAKTNINSFGEIEPYDFKRGMWFISNCQSCVLAYEMRRRGFDVQAFGSLLKKGTKANTIATNSVFTCFLKRSGANCSLADGYHIDGIDDIEKLRTELNKHARVGRYCLRERANGRCHVIVVDNGVVYDPQNGISCSINSYESNCEEAWILRIDDKLIDPNCVNGVVF